MSNPLARRARIKDLSNKAEGIFQYVGNDNVLFRLISTGNKLTKVEVVASNVSFCGSKAAERAVVKDFDQQTANHVQEAKVAQSAPQKPQNVPEYSQGSADDFSVIDDSEDLPF